MHNHFYNTQYMLFFCFTIHYVKIIFLSKRERERGDNKNKNKKEKKRMISINYRSSCTFI